MRDVTLDNFKFILIFLVVLGHMVEPVMGRYEWVKSIYVFIYLFHMPMFAYVSGVVSSRDLNDKMVRGLIAKLLVPYFCLELVYSIFDYILFSKGSLNVSPLMPYWILWYLLSLIFWRLMLPVFVQLRFPVAIAVIAGLACGINNLDYNLSFSRTFVFFPFFLVGYFYHSRIVGKMQGFNGSALVGSSVIFLVFTILLAVPGVQEFKVGWLYGSRSYARLGAEWEYGVFYRFSLYILALILGLSLLSIVQKTKNIFTSYGENSLYIYVLHGFVVKGLVFLGVFSYVDSSLKVVFLILGSLLLLPVLSLRYLKVLARQMMNPFGLVSLVLSNKRERITEFTYQRQQ
ncbi:acyltransferase family protein [Microbulbifer sp. VAAC004]|uniref:acyltransferase family protein n=1 Tax=unclassified Microbulbifer TaxID=2619833 RepID=UPI00403A1498